jgi:outer membrane biosynthesis protein TonB
MEPIKINVNIEVGLKQTTLEALKSIFGPQILPSPIKIEEPEPQPEAQPEPKRKAETKEGPEPQPEAPATVEDDDLPPNDAPDPVRETPTEDDARQAVKAARGRGVPAKAIKDFMQKEFNIASSVECPAERRQALIDGLNKLAA